MEPREDPHEGRCLLVANRLVKKKYYVRKNGFIETSAESPPILFPCVRKMIGVGTNNYGCVPHLNKVLGKAKTPCVALRAGRRGIFADVPNSFFHQLEC